MNIRENEDRPTNSGETRCQPVSLAGGQTAVPFRWRAMIVRGRPGFNQTRRPNENPRNGFPPFPQDIHLKSSQNCLICRPKALRSTEMSIQPETGWIPPDFFGHQDHAGAGAPHRMPAPRNDGQDPSGIGHHQLPIVWLSPPE